MVCSKHAKTIGLKYCYFWKSSTLYELQLEKHEKVNKQSGTLDENEALLNIQLPYHF